MADIQREFERQEKRAQKERRKKIVIWVIIAVVIVVLAVMKISEININSVISRFVDSDGSIEISENYYPYTLDASQNVKMVNVNNKLGVLTPNSFSIINSQNAETEYGFQHGYSNPVLETAGIYSLVYNQGGDFYRLDTISSSVYEEDIDSSILCANVSKDGDVAVATTSKDALCQVVVYSKTLKELFNVNTSEGYIVSIALSDNGKKVAFATVSGENANIVTKVSVYNVSNGAKEYETVILPSGSLIDLSFCGNNIYTVGDSYAGIINKSGKYENIFDDDSTISTRSFCYSPSGDLIIAYNSFSNSTDNKVAYVKKNASIKTEISIDSNVKSVTASSSLISVLTNSEVISYSISNGEEKGKFTVDDSVNSICRMGSEVFLNKQSVIDRGEADND